MKVDYLIICQEDSRACYKRGWPEQKPHLSIVLRCEEARRSREHFRVSLELFSLRNTHLDHLYLRATSPYRHVCSKSNAMFVPRPHPFYTPPSCLRVSILDTVKVDQAGSTVFRAIRPKEIFKFNPV